MSSVLAVMLAVAVSDTVVWSFLLLPLLLRVLNPYHDDAGDVNGNDYEDADDHAEDYDDD